MTKQGEELAWEDVELQIKWGVLRGLRLRPRASERPPRRVLALHGWLDNCKAFDPLASYLAPNIDLVALDLPGHGFSDHLPMGAKYDSLTYALSMKEAMHEYGWDTFVLLSHSLGSSIGHFLVSLFPEMVEAFISIDFFGYKGVPTKIVTFPIFKHEVQNFYRLGNLTRDPPKYSKEEVLEKLVESRVFKTNPDQSMTLPFAKTLFDRAVKPVGDLYTWTHDPRVKAPFLLSPGYRFMWAMTMSISCPTLLIRATNGIYPSSGLDEKRMVASYSKNCDYFKYVKVAGRHHVHMTNAETVAFHINDFLDSAFQEKKLSKSKKNRIKSKL